MWSEDKFSTKHKIMLDVLDELIFVNIFNLYESVFQKFSMFQADVSFA